MCVCVRRHIAKLRQEWFNGLSWNFVGMLGATMPRMYQILVTNQLNLRDYILYYPRDYRFPCRHNAWLSLWKVLTYHVTLAGDYFYHNFDVPRNSVVTRSVCYIIDSSNTVSSLHLHVCSTCVSDFFDFGYSESIRVQLAAANVLRRITSISWRPSVSRLWANNNVGAERQSSEHSSLSHSPSMYVLSY